MGAARNDFMRRLRWPGAILLILILVPLAAWAFDTWMGNDLVVRNTKLGGQPIGGQGAADIAPVIAAAAQRLSSTTVKVVTPQGVLATTSSEITLVVDQQATLDRALQLGSQAPLWKQPLNWVKSFFAPREAPVVALVDDAKLASVIAQRDPTQRVEPIEPNISVDDQGGLRAVPGVNGHGLQLGAVHHTLLKEAEHGRTPLVASTQQSVLPPRFGIEDAEKLAREAASVLKDPIEVQAGDDIATVAPEMLRRWAKASTSSAGLVLDLDVDKALPDLAKLAPDAGVEPVDASFKVVGGSPVIVAGKNGTACCAPEAVQHILESLRTRQGATPLDRQQQPAKLPLRVTEPTRSAEDARAMGIVEQVGTFTTKHPANQPRVTNIHKIADLVQGTIIEAGKRLSINDLVGRRTAEKGFVPAGVIYEGAFTDDIGGGVSQFATTLFNAAFFAGLDIPEYQSHSIWLSRYPRGREATLSYPKPDLVIENSTPHAVLIWSTYDATSITVSMYSTRTVVGEQTGQTEAPHGACTRVTTERTRRWLDDGHTDVDHFRATYRPEEKVPC